MVRCFSLFCSHLWDLLKYLQMHSKTCCFLYQKFDFLRVVVTRANLKIVSWRLWVHIGFLSWLRGESRPVLMLLFTCSFLANSHLKKEKALTNPNFWTLTNPSLLLFNSPRVCRHCYQLQEERKDPFVFSSFGVLTRRVQPLCLWVTMATVSTVPHWHF